MDFALLNLSYTLQWYCTPAFYNLTSVFIPRNTDLPVTAANKGMQVWLDSHHYKWSTFVVLTEVAWKIFVISSRLIDRNGTSIFKSTMSKVLFFRSSRLRARLVSCSRWQTFYFSHSKPDLSNERNYIKNKASSIMFDGSCRLRLDV